MRVRLIVCGLVVVVAGGGAAWWFAGGRPSRAEPAPRAAREAGPLPGQPAGAVLDAGALASTRHPPLGDALGAPATKPEREARVVHALLEGYRRVVGEFPVGEDNRQIVCALLGANAKRMPVLARDHPRLNNAGELVDAWGRPFFFHLISREHLEVRSAGPDREFYTKDDLVAGSPPPPATGPKPPGRP